MGWARQAFGGLATWTTLMFEAMQIQSQNVVGQARLVVGTDRIHRVDGPKVTDLIELWNWARAKVELPKLAEALLEENADLLSKQFLYGTAAPYEPLYTPRSPPSP